MGVLICLSGVYDLNGFNDAEVIKWNRMQCNIDEIFDNAIKVGRYD